MGLAGTKSKKVLIIDNSSDITGAFKSIVNYTERLSPEFDFHFCIDRNSKVVYILKHRNYLIFDIPMLELRKDQSFIIYLPVLLINTIRLLKYIRKNKIAAIHVNDLYNMLGITLKLFSPSLFIVYHIRLLPDSYISKLYQIWTYLISKFSDRIICVSDIVRKKFPFRTNKLITLYDALDPAQITISKNYSKKERLVILYIANYIQGKGHIHAIEAIRRVVKEYPDLTLKFIGGDLNKKKNRQYRQNLQEMVLQYNLTDFVVFRNLQRNLENEFRDASMFLNFSESESFSMTCLEALAHGLPVIATRSGGPEELIDDMENGILVPKGDIVSMTRAIFLLIKNEELRDKFSISGPQKVREKYNIDHLAQGLKRIYMDAF